jgi:GTPase SAR1 family protein
MTYSADVEIRRLRSEVNKIEECAAADRKETLETFEALMRILRQNQESIDLIVKRLEALENLNAEQRYALGTASKP